MILVTVGTNEAPFDRLLRALDGRPDDGEELIVQHGPSPVRPPRATCVEFLPYDELVAAIGRARIVVTHAGVGSIMTALANGKRPVVVPRLARFGEAVDDHQLGLGRRLDAEGLVSCAETDVALLRALDEPPEGATLELGASRRLVADLRSYVEANRR
jgi:UDP-N-acetylglucosamine transferase subunit ALG13